MTLKTLTRLVLFALAEQLFFVRKAGLFKVEGYLEGVG